MCIYIYITSTYILPPQVLQHALLRLRGVVDVLLTLLSVLPPGAARRATRLPGVVGSLTSYCFSNFYLYTTPSRCCSMPYNNYIQLHNIINI